MAIDKFIPEIWSARLLSNLNPRLVYADCVNRDYEGEVKGAGDTVHINGIGRVTVTDYVKNTDHAAPEALTDAQTTLLIDQQKMFNFQVDDIEAAQANPKVMNEAMKEAAVALAKTTDLYLAGFHTGVDAANVIGSDGTPTTITAANAYETLVDFGVMLDEVDCPEEDRFVVLPSWFEGMLLKDARFIGYGTQGNVDTRDNGKIGRAAGFVIRKSNNVPNTTKTKYKIMAGHKSALSFADQISKTEAFRPQLRFADAVKGLHVYGAKLVRPKMIAIGTFNKG